MSKHPLSDFLDLTGRNVLVTGSTSGIGKGIAIGLANAGCNVMINGLGLPEEIETFRLELEKTSGRKIIYSNADLTNPSEIDTMFDVFKEAFGDIHGVINNAGIQHIAPIEDFPTEKWDQILSLNLSSIFHTTRLAFSEMKARNWGRIINISSAHGLTASPFKSAYVTAKHGVMGFTKTAALEGAEFGIRVNAICPGYVHTPLVDNQIQATAKARNLEIDEVIKTVMLDRQPTKEFTTIEEIARMTCFLMSDAANSITGADIKMEGGWTAL
ncbi:3-hydroxybutyrate dehydrogenase [Hirschia baltica]|uniref:3-hydroxybutyrate dehydrogenase n=1 Tax=Hirschia baltica (strain ATCC 49814 / DSM 5838 / IFAM 1418) TaxID=582402 RepID=C6XJI6_HIRBI|nr:3-hydroxybutyrate dehydrogenase [Hirschia baltica]ACT59281.1 3-hydroxybutyrate dehydrogenase [Hirschia baltica ATCC 49814]